MSTTRKACPGGGKPRCAKEATSLHEARSQSQAVLALAVRIRAPFGLGTPHQTPSISDPAKEAVSLPEAASPELGGCIPACRQDPSTVRAKRPPVTSS